MEFGCQKVADRVDGADLLDAYERGEIIVEKGIIFLKCNF